MSLRVVIVPIRADNYSYLVVDELTKDAAAVDAQDPTAVLAAAEKEGVRITAILHWDHAGGNAELSRKLPGVPVYGGKGDDAEAVTVELDQDDTVTIGGLTVKTLFTPCHTAGHVCFFVENPAGGPPAVFTGDTLFVGGCGNFNSGTPAQMHKAMTLLATCPPETLVYVGHEYTVANFRYAVTVEPDNPDFTARAEWAAARRAAGEPTVPSTMADELATNVFMRTTEPVVQGYCGVGSDPVAVLAELRKLKTAFGRRK